MTHADTPRFTGRHAKADYLAYLADSPRVVITQSAAEGAAASGQFGVGPYLIARGLLEAAPALDCGDLRATFQRSKADAAATLTTLTRPQLVLQAWCYTAYLSEQRGETVDPEGVLANWDRGLARHAVAVE